MTKTNLTAVRSILHHHILNTLRNGARGAEYVRIMSGATKAEIEGLVRGGVLSRLTEGNRKALRLSRLGEAFLMAANAQIASAGGRQ